MCISKNFDVVVIGAGHAGAEASLACARNGLSVAFLTMDPRNICRMSCNPAIGGLAKGHLVREIDALGGEMGKATDDTSIQSRVLNKSQGPAVWGLRAQCDKHLYSDRMRSVVENQPGLMMIRETVNRLVVEGGVAKGVLTDDGNRYSAKAVILTTGTFLNGLMHIGELKIDGGRTNEPAARGISEHLRDLGFPIERLKTGTNPRVKKESIDFSTTKAQPGDEKPAPFSHFTTEFPKQPQTVCYITHTNSRTRRIILGNLDRSPLFSGDIKGTGPRYCPSIEDKYVKFPDRESHQIFLEPEGLETDEFYLNGLSTSLPLDVQQAYLHTVKGLENAVIARPGYAVEYDFVPPTQLHHTLETKRIRNLFFAGQINGTSGYEEAGAQGLIAGINAAMSIKGKPPFVLSRTEAYIGVLIDDLVTKGTDEPYRMFTSRAEYRLLLRPDNADLRLMEKGHALGLISKEACRAIEAKKRTIKNGLGILKETSIPLAATIGQDATFTKKDRAVRVFELLKRPDVHYEKLRPHLPASLRFEDDVAFQLEVELKYEGYLNRQREEINQRARFENIAIPEEIFLGDMSGVSREAKEKLLVVKPATIGQVSRIPGITPADVTVLILAVSRHQSGLSTPQMGVI